MRGDGVRGVRAEEVRDVRGEGVRGEVVKE